MKKSGIAAVLVFLLIGLLFVGCDMSDGPNKTGSLQLSIGNGIPRSTTLTPDFDMSPASYAITGVGPNQASFSSSGSNSAPTKWTSLVVGEWTVTVDAYNAEGQQVGSGTETVTIESGVTKEIRVVVRPLTGSGSLHLGFTYDANEVLSPVVSAICTPLAGGDSFPLEFTIDTTRGIAHVQKDSIPTGYYSLVMKLLDGDTFFTSQVHTVRIIKDQRTEETFDFGRTLYSVSGKVLDEEGAGLPGVTITFSKGYSDEITDDHGLWSKNGIDYNDGAITIAPQSSEYSIGPGSVVVDGYRDDIVFVGIPNGPNAEGVVLNDSVRIIPKSGFSEILELAPERMRISSSSILLSNLQVGDVLVAVDLPESLGGGGLMSKVTDISNDGDGVEVLLENAMLVDVIRDGSFHGTNQVSGEQIAQGMSSRGVQAVISIVTSPDTYEFTFKLEEDGVDAGELKGKLKIGGITTEDHDIDIKFGGLKNFRCVVSPGFTIENSITVGQYLNWGTTKEQERLFSFDLPPIPVWGPLFLILRVSIEAGANLRIGAGIMTGYSYERGLRAGVDYSDGEWTKIFESTGDGFTIEEPVFEGDVTASAFGGIELSGAASVAKVGEVGLSLFIHENIEAKGDVHYSPMPLPRYSLDNYLSAGLRANLGVLQIVRMTKEWQPYEFSRHTIAYSASGFVRDHAGKGIGNVEIKFSGDRGAVKTDSNGYWIKPIIFGDVTATPSLDDHVFSPGFLEITGKTREANFTFFERLAPPSFSRAGGTYSSNQTVAITHPVSNATIRYTTDGSDPSETHGTIYSSPITIAHSTNLKAIAYGGPNYAPSRITSAVYTIQYPTVAAPSFSPSPGTYGPGQNIQLSCSTSGATIMYTTDGSNPSSGYGTVYNGPITLDNSTTIKAMAYRSGYTSSAIVSAQYGISNPALAIDPASITNGSSGQTYTFTLNATGIPSGVSSIKFEWNFGDGSGSATGSRTVAVTNSTASTTILHSYTTNSVYGMVATASAGGTTYGSATASVTIGTPIVRPEVDLDVLDVWKAANSGGAGLTTDRWDISMLPNNCQFDLRYDMQGIPDRVIVEYPEGTVRHDSGWRGNASYQGNPMYPGGIAGDGYGEVFGMFRKGSSDYIKVTVIGGQSGTVWGYKMRARE